MIVDYHNHTPLCKHAEGSPEEYLEVAKVLGVDELGFADHLPWPTGYDSKWRMKPEEFPSYRDMILNLKEKSQKVKVRYAVELDWVDGKMNEVAAEIAGEPFDYILGSIHSLDGFPFDDPEMIPVWEGGDVTEKVWNTYGEKLIEFISTFDFDIIAHIDLPKKYGFFPYSTEKFYSDIDKALKIAGEKGMALEINTAGLRKPIKELYPNLKVLKLARKNGVMLTLGSDAHAPDQVMKDFDKALNLANEGGFTEIASFDQRKVTLNPIG